MTPGFVSTTDWIQIAAANNNLLLFVLLIIISAASFVVAHAAVPSLVSSYELSSRVLVARPVLYVFGLVFLLLALVTVNQALTDAIAVVSRLFPRWLI
jgi:hypothetical protein